MLKYKHRRSKRSYSPKRLALVLITTGVFLVGLISFPQRASAQSLTLMSPAFNDNILKMQELKSEADRKEEKIQAIMPQVEQVQKEQQAVDRAKAGLKLATTKLEKEVAELKVKVAEKKRLEALRTVTIASYAPDAAGNLYAPGNCTWYAKSRRPDLSNSLGNANTWYERAAEQGFKVGTMAKTNAIGTTTRGWLGHVVYVEKWLGNGKILISEMNINGLYSMQTRVADESEFVYIYERP